MLRRSQGLDNLIPLDLEIEATFWPLQRRERRQREKIRRTDKANMEHNPNTNPFWDFMMLDPNAILSSIMRPVVETNNF